MPNTVYTVAERIEMVRHRMQGLSYQHVTDHFTATYPARPTPSKTTVKRIVSRFLKTGNVDPSLIKIIKPNKRLSHDTKLDICLAVEERPKKSTTEIARELGISQSSVSRVLRKEKYQKKHKLKANEESSESDDDDESFTRVKIERVVEEDDDDAEQGEQDFRSHRRLRDDDHRITFIPVKIETTDERDRWKHKSRMNRLNFIRIETESSNSDLIDSNRVADKCRTESTTWSADVKELVVKSSLEKLKSEI